LHNDLLPRATALVSGVGCVPLEHPSEAWDDILATRKDVPVLEAVWPSGLLAAATANCSPHVVRGDVQASGAALKLLSPRRVCRQPHPALLFMEVNSIPVSVIGMVRKEGLPNLHISRAVHNALGLFDLKILNGGPSSASNVGMLKPF
jgi:hypothetical protein